MSQLVDALFYMDNSLLGMGDSYSDYVSQLYQTAFGDIEDFDDCSEEELDELHKKALSVLSKDADFLKNSLEYYSYGDNEFYANMAALYKESNKLLNVLTLLEKYSLVVLEKTYDIFKLIPFLKEHGEFIEKCNDIGYAYWTYLDNDLWGTQTSDCGTTGEVLLDSNYQYVTHVRVNQIDSHIKYDAYLKHDRYDMEVVVKQGEEVVADFFPTGVTPEEIGKEIGHNLNSVLDKHNNNK